jgi:hypothetical protein
LTPETVLKTETAEASARHILRLIVGHFHGTPGRVLREASLLRALSGTSWDTEEFAPGRLYALKYGWLSAAAETLTLTSAGYAAAFVQSPGPEKANPT